MGQVVRAKIQRWGNGLGLRVAGLLRDIPQFQPDAEVEVEVFEDGFRVTRSKPTAAKLPFSESDLLEGLNSHNAHADLLAQPNSTEFGD